MEFVLKTSRLVLRPLEENDIKDMYDVIRSHPDLVCYMTWSLPKDISETMENFKKSRERQLKGELVRWGIFLDKQFVGVVGLEDVTRNVGKWKVDVAELGYWISPEFHNQGIMTEAGKVVLKYGFQELGLHKVVVMHLKENVASQRVIEKLGFRKVGVSKDYCFHDGRWWDDIKYEMNVDEWEKL